MRHIVQGTITPLQEITAPPAVNLDSWIGSPGRSVRTQPRSFFSQARTITFTEIAPLDWSQDFSRELKFTKVRRGCTAYDLTEFSVPAAPETVTTDKWTPPYAETRRTKPRINGTSELILNTFAETTSLDRWRPSSNRQSLITARALRDATAAFQFPIVGEVETITSDKWTASSDRIHRAKPRPFFSNARTITFAEIAPLDWAQDFSREWTFRTQRRAKTAYDFTEFSAPAAETVTLDKWRVESRPADRALRGPRGVSELILDTFLERTTPDKWLAYPRVNIRPRRQVLWTPPDFKSDDSIYLVAELSDGDVGPIYTSYSVASWDDNCWGVFTAETITADKWEFAAQPMRPTRFDRKGTADLILNTFAETASLDKWIGSLGDVRRLVKIQRPDLSTIEQRLLDLKWTPEASAGRFFPAPRRAPQPELTTLEQRLLDLKWTPEASAARWFATIRPIRSAQELLHVEAAPESITLDKWSFRDHLLRRVIPPPPRAFTNLIRDTFAETVSADRWITSGHRTPRLIKPINRSSDQYPTLITESVTLDKWLTLFEKTRAANRGIQQPTEVTLRGIDGLLDLDKWQAPFPRLIRPTKPILTQNDLLRLLELIRPDQWQTASVDIRQRFKRLLQRDLSAYGSDISLVLEVLNLDKWEFHFQPVFRKYGLHTPTVYSAALSRLANASIRAMAESIDSGSLDAGDSTTTTRTSTTAVTVSLPSKNDASISFD